MNITLLSYTKYDTGIKAMFNVKNISLPTHMLFFS